ncbi:MAG: MBL fold metallo-hydrolase [Actinomycetota bacterium]
MAASVRVVLNGVRGSTPCAGAEYLRFGGSSSCVAIESDGAPPIILDLGTGLRRYSSRWEAPGAEPFRGHVLLTHLHWDHVQGLPFFTPLHQAGARVEIHGPAQETGRLGDVFGRMMGSPFFPIGPSDLAADVCFSEVADDDFAIGPAKVRSRWVRHTDPTLGFRVEVAGRVVVYLPDHGQACGDHGDDHVPDAVLELCDGADVLIHDAQHTTEEFGPKRHWGHCTVDYALHVGREAGARHVVLFITIRRMPTMISTGSRRRRATSALTSGFPR